MNDNADTAQTASRLRQMCEVLPQNERFLRDAFGDGWFSVTPIRGENPLHGKVMRGDLVQLLRGGQS